MCTRGAVVDDAVRAPVAHGYRVVFQAREDVFDAGVDLSGGGLV